MKIHRLIPLASLALIAGGAAIPALAVKERFAKFNTYQNAKHGFAIAFPEGVFKSEPVESNEDGQMYASPDGRARLLVGALVNEDQRPIGEYRELVMQESYAGAKLDYAPLKERWFVLSGVRQGNTFYERVTFTCGGKLINSWAMVYPSAEAQLYDRVVEAVARSYSPGAGRTGKCD